MPRKSKPKSVETTPFYLENSLVDEGCLKTLFGPVAGADSHKELLQFAKKHLDANPNATLRWIRTMTFGNHYIDGLHTILRFGPDGNLVFSWEAAPQDLASSDMSWATDETTRKQWVNRTLTELDAEAFRQEMVGDKDLVISRGWRGG